MMVCAANIQLNETLSNLLPPLTDNQRQGLEADILRDGCISPLIVWSGILVDGHHRYAICRKHGISFEVREMSFPNLLAAGCWTWEHHEHRRNMSLYTAAEAALRFEPLFAEKAKENQQRGGLIGAEITNRGSQSSDNPDPMDTNKELAKKAGISHDTIAKVKYIRDHADEETKNRLHDRETTINAEYLKLRREEKEQQREARRAENVAQIAGATSLDDILKSGARFATIIIDPPWDWGDEGDCDQLGRARPTYGTMPLEKLLKLPVDKLADEDCHLYLWITNRSLPKGFALLDRWEFRYVTALTWCKPSFGMGTYFRGSTEHVLFGVRGSQPLKRKDAGTWFSAPRGPLGHSSKPVEFYDLVESCSPGPYLEMFARGNRDGWVSWGADANDN